MKAGVKEKSRITGVIRASVITLDVVGQAEMGKLRKEFAGVDIPKRNPEYIKRRQEIYAAHGHQKHRVTWNLSVFIVMIQCAIRKKWDEVVNVWRYEYSVNHNIVTDQGDALIADLMQVTPVKTKVDGTNGHITVGTGWTGTTPKQNEAVNTPTGSPELLDSPYPQLKGAFGAADDNVVQYRAIFEAGDLTATVDEAGLGNNATEASGDNLAYGNVTPDAVVTVDDSLQIDWELTLLGA